MKKRPNAIQKLIHKIVMLGPVSAFFAPRIHTIDTAILKLTNGKYSAAEILGWNIIQLTTVGAKTGKPHTLPLVGLLDGENIALVASSFGRAHNPGWYYNLKKNPECCVDFRSRSGDYIARETSGDEYQHYWKLAISAYAGYEKYKERAAHRHIPVIVLEPKK